MANIDPERILRYFTPNPLPDGSTWTARFLEGDEARHFTLTFDVSLFRTDGSTDTFEVVVREPSDWGREPDATRAAIHFGSVGAWAFVREGGCRASQPGASASIISVQNARLYHACFRSAHGKVQTH